MAVTEFKLGGSQMIRIKTDLAVGCHVESLAKNIFLHLGITVLIELLRSALAEHLILGPDTHRNVHECLVQEGNAGFETPGHRRSSEGQIVGVASNRGVLRTYWP